MDKLRRANQQLQDELAATKREAAVSEEMEVVNPRAAVRQELYKWRDSAALHAKIQETTPSAENAAALARAQEQIRKLQVEQVEGQPIDERIRNLEGAIERGGKSMDRLAGEAAEILENIKLLQESYDKRQKEFQEKHDKRMSDQAQRAALLAKKAAEAGANTGGQAAQAAAPAPPPAPGPAEFRNWLQSLVTVPGATPGERSAVESLWAKAEQMVGQPSAVPTPVVEAVPAQVEAAGVLVPVPPSPTATAAEAPAAELPAAEEQLVGEAAAAGRNEHATGGGSAVEPTMDTPMVLDAGFQAAVSAAAAAKRQRTQR